VEVLIAIDILFSIINPPIVYRLVYDVDDVEFTVITSPGYDQSQA
jgi:hypothetical protein